MTSCSESENEPNKEVRYMMPRTEKVQLTYKQKEMVKNHNAFAFELLRAAYDLQQSGKDKDKSFCLSPMGATYLLGMAGSGAAGETRKQIVDALGMSTASAKDINDLCRTIIKDAPGTDKQVTLETANALYANKDIALKEQFCKDMNTYYEADARSLDFSDPGSLDIINNWMKEKTDGKITNALDWLDVVATAYLANATYFKPTWTKHFDKENTKTEAFNMEDGTTRQVQMMNNVARVRAYSANKISSTMICLPFGSGTAWNMYVITPAARGGTLDKLVTNLDTEAWEELMSKGFNGEMEIKIPKFSTTYMADIDKAMRKMGVTRVFTMSAELKGMSHNEVAYIRQMTQKSRIDVDEDNAKTIATENGIEEPEISDDDIQLKSYFYADRPFVYLICENSTNAVFFAGVYQGD
ncbi:MAG: hypothetical protein II261_07975 [Bacteroidaceae bacterium]|nr:hypothetical protein [Bacteroidaceae bacterium]